MTAPAETRRTGPLPATGAASGDEIRSVASAETEFISWAMDVGAPLKRSRAESVELADLAILLVIAARLGMPEPQLRGGAWSTGTEVGRVTYRLWAWDRDRTEGKAARAAVRGDAA